MKTPNQRMEFSSNADICFVDRIQPYLIGDNYTVFAHFVNVRPIWRQGTCKVTKNLPWSEFSEQVSFIEASPPLHVSWAVFGSPADGLAQTDANAIFRVPTSTKLL